MLLIKHAAVKSKDGLVITARSHAECFHKAHDLKIKMSQKADDQGFVDSIGHYVTRLQAADIAAKAGQVDKELHILFSEDLWGSEGKYYYDEFEGYCLRSLNES